MDFLRAAFALSRRSVYSLHKSSTRDYIQRLATRELRAQSGGRGVRGPQWGSRREGRGEQRGAAVPAAAGRTRPGSRRNNAPAWLPPSAAEVLAELRYDLPATYKFHK